MFFLYSSLTSSQRAHCAPAAPASSLFLQHTLSIGPLHLLFLVPLNALLPRYLPDSLPLSPPGLVSNVIFSMRPSLIPLFKIITPSWHPVSFPALILSLYLIWYTLLFFPLFSPILYFPPSMKGSAPWRQGVLSVLFIHVTTDISTTCLTHNRYSINIFWMNIALTL